jgi:hypothetical protein
VAITLFTQNLLETAAAVTSSLPAGGKPVTRLYDRDRGPQFQAENAWVLHDVFPLSLAQETGQALTLDIDLGTAQPVTAWALVNHNLSGVTVTLLGDTTSPPTTVRDSVAATGVDTLRTFASLSLRYWRVSVPAMATPVRIGELLLGVPRTITQNPFVRQSATVTLGNVRRDESPGGFTWATRLGVKRVRLPYGWTSLSEADVDTLEAAYDEIDQGAKHLLVQDVTGVLRWMAWLGVELNPTPIGGGEYEVAIDLQESL